MDSERIRSAPEERQSWSSLSKTESMRSVSSEPSRLEDDDDFLSDIASESFHSASTGDVPSLYDDGSYWSHEAAVPRGHAPLVLTSVPGLQQPARSQRLELHHQIQLRRQIDHLSKVVAEKEYQVEQNREQLLRCREHLSSLLDQCATLEREERGEGEGAGGVAARGMLRARLAKIRAEITAEEAVERALQGSLQQTELGLSEAQLAAGKISQTAAQLREEEGLVQEMRGRQAMKRLQSQTRMMVNAERSLKAQDRLYQSTLEMQEEQTRAAIERARQAQQEGRRFLQETLGRQRRKEVEEGAWHRAHLEQRMKAMLSLKGNIETSQGTMQAQQNLQNEKERQRKLSKLAERERILAEGGNPDQELLKRQRVEEFEKKRESFECRQRERQVAIVGQLLEEAEAQRRAERKTAKAHWHGRQQAPHHSTRHLHQQKLRRRKQRPGIMQQPPGSSGEAPVTKPTNEDHGGVEKENRQRYADSSDEEKSVTPPRGGIRPVSAVSGVEESLAEPEIRGLWEDSRADSKSTEGRWKGLKEESGGGGGGGKAVSKLEQEMMETAMEKLRRNVVVRQVAAGREFKGCAFISKPEEVVFRDFDVGRSYRQRVQLTNVSYSVNYCKLVGLSQCLRDFITVDFEPPGSMSAGLACHMSVMFEPKLNEDLLGEMEFLSQTGPFSIPVHCLTKKCIVSVDKAEVDFGRVCVGETVRGQVTLRNSGALPTKFWFAAIVKKPSLQVSSQSTASGQPSSQPPAAGGQLSDRSTLSIMTTMETPMPREDLLAMRQQLQSRSVGDLRGGLEQKSLTWDDQKPAVGTAPEGESGERKEGRGVGSSRRGRREESTDVKAKDEGGETVTAEAQQEAGIIASQTVVTGGIGEGEAPGDQVQEGSVMMALSEAALSEQEASAPPAITVRKVSEGMLAPFSSLTLELLFSPEIAGSQSALFRLSFQNPSVPPVTISAGGQGMDLPVFVEREIVDLRLCMVDRLYQDSLVVHNRAATALRVMFEVPPSLQRHLEILPRHGLVQGDDSFTAQLKFMPRAGIFSDGHRYLVDLDSGSGQLEVPLEILVANQTLPVPFTLRAQVTVSDIEFSPSSIDFGSCTVHESVVASLQLTNKSLLPQEFGFVHLPDVVEVQPNDGFGTLLPWESLSLDVVFSARKAREYGFEITCKTATDRTFKLPCRGAGVLPPLELSANAINFAPTAINDTRTATVTIRNPKLSRLNSAVIRGAVLPQGPKAFELAVPEGFPIAVSPRVGVVPLGQSMNIQIQFSPRLDTASIREEATQLAALATPPEDPKKEEGQSTSAEQEGEEQPSPRKKAKQPSSRQSQKSSLPSSSKTSLSSSSQTKPAEVQPPTEGSDLWCQASSNLLSSYKAHCLQVTIPCFVSSEDPESKLEAVAFRAKDTLYLEVSAPVVRPALIPVSDCGRTTINFGNVGTGDMTTKVVTLQNISQDSLSPTSSLLDPHGPFELRNALRELPPGATHNAILRFSPQQGGKYYEPLQFHYGHTSSLELRLTGEGVEPNIALCLEGEVLHDTLDVGHTFAGDTVTKVLQLRNDCSLGVAYRVSLESVQPSARKRTGNSFKASNYNGQPPFNCVPFQGMIDSGKSAEISLTFSPDHQTPFYADTLFVEINGQLSHSLHLKGSAWSNNVYPLGGEPTGPGEESMAAVVSPAPGQAPPPSPILVLFMYHMGDEGGEASVSREIEIGCIKTPLVKKNSGDFVIESIPSSNPHAKAFSIDPMKSSVEAGSTKTITLTFQPVTNSMRTVEATTNLILKGDTVQTYQLLLRGLVCE